MFISIVELRPRLNTISFFFVIIFVSYDNECTINHISTLSLNENIQPFNRYSKQVGPVDVFVIHNNVYSTDLVVIS